jgi:hypothetical protein
MLAVVCGTVAVCGGILLLSSAHWSPAQTVEKKPSPTEARSAPAKDKSSDSSGSSSSTRFDGTWRVAGSWKDRVGNTFNETRTIIIKNGVANLTSEMTSTLAPGSKWNDVPAPYNSSSPLHTKRTNKSSDLKMEGSNLKVHWQGSRLTDWAPKTIPNGALKDTFKDGMPSTVLFVLNEDHLIVTSGLRSATYTRVQ